MELCPRNAQALEPMTITIEYDADTDRYHLMVSDGRMSPMPAGPRLFRAPPFPEIKWAHDALEGAKIDAALLPRYVTINAEKKGKR